nr:putative late blight resistance protein homolog R1A-3 [Ipomoea batatas]
MKLGITMTILGRLPNLEVLQLKLHAFDDSETEWEQVEEGFPKLKVLVFKYPKLHIWKDSDFTFPSLECLVLKVLCYLESLPYECLSRCPCLKLIHLEGYCRDGVLESAKKIQNDGDGQLEIEDDGNIKLSITCSSTNLKAIKHPSAMSKNPILSPPKNLFPLLQLWKAPSNTPSLLPPHLLLPFWLPHPEQLLRVYDNWEDAKAQVHRFSDNLYKSFPSKDEAISAFNTFNQRQQNSFASFVGASNAASTSSSQNSTAAGNNSSPLEPMEILSDPWELLVEDIDLYRGCEDFCDAHGLQEDDVLIFRHVGYFKFHFFVIRNKEQLDLPEAHGDGIERQPAEDGEAIFVPTMSSINLDVGLTTLSGCRTLAIDFIEFCNDESILTNFIFSTESEGDTVDVRHDTFTLTFINVGELINYGEQHAFLRRILCRHRNVIRYLVFFNYEVGEVHLIAFDKCGMEIMIDDLYDFTIEEYANADASL